MNQKTIPAARLVASTFESYMLTDQTPGYPLTFWYHLTFSSQIDAALFQAAVDDVQKSHPLLTAIPNQQRGIWTWTPHDRSIAIDFAGRDTPLTSPHGLAIDLQQEPGIRIWCRTDDTTTELSLQVHHAVSDGLGILQFLFDALAVYHLHFQPRDSDPAGKRTFRLRTIDPAMLPERDNIDFSPPEKIGGWKTIRFTVAEATKMLGRQPCRVLGKPASPPEDPPAPTTSGQVVIPQMHSSHLSPEQSEAYRQRAKEKGVMANDLFLRDLFVTLVAWSEERGTPLPGRRVLRLTMPISVRKREHVKMSAANVISYGFLTRPVSMIKTPDSLLESIAAETAAIKYWRLGGMFLGSIGALQKARLLAPLLKLPSCFSSMVLSNLGDIAHAATAKFPKQDRRLVAGNLVLQTFAAAPPARPKTHAAVAVSRYAKGFSIGIQTDDTIGSNSRRQLLDRYVQQIERTAKDG